MLKADNKIQLPAAFLHDFYIKNKFSLSFFDY